MSSPGISDNDRVALTFLGILAGPALLGTAAILWGQGGEWLVAHRILVGSSEQPLLVIPGMAGAGLDLSRAAIGAAAIIAAAALAVGGLHRRWVRRREGSAL